MSKTITLRVPDETYKKIHLHAQSDNRTLSNYIETALLRQLEEESYVDSFEMEEIQNNPELMERLKKGSRDARRMKGKLIG